MTAYTSLLGLALPVTGELSGTWGDTVNNSITSLLDSAIAGTQTLTTDTTLSTTTGSANTSRQAILLCSPASANITITAPAQSKIYTVINTSATYTVTVRGAGPTTGVTLGVSEKAVVAWNGSDFVKVSNTTGDGTFANLTVTGNTSLGDADTDTITQAASYVTGTQLKSAKTATNTLSLAAYDVDGTAYTDLITLTASNTPTLALTSTGVGTINNMSIGATTASTGAFTTLTSNGATTFTAGTASTSTTTGTAVITGGLGVSGRINAANFDGIIGANTAAAGAFTTLSSTGNTTLGDASTDTVTVNGYMGVGGAGNAGRAINVVSTALTGTAQFGASITPTNSATGTSQLTSIYSSPIAANNVTTVRHYYVDNATGAGTVTSQIGVDILDLTKGSTNIGLQSAVSSGTNKWNIYASGTADNYFAGNVGIGRVPTASDTWAGGSAIPILDIAKSAGFPVILSKGYSTTANQGGILVLAHSKSATVGTQTATANGDTFGYVSFEGVNSSSAAASGGYIQAIQDSTAGATYIPSALTFYTGTNAAAPVERMRIDSAGIVNISMTGTETGATNGFQFLSTAGSGGLTIYSSATTRDQITFKNSVTTGPASGTASAIGVASGAMTFKTGGSDRLIISSAGNVGIGSTSSAYTFVITNNNTTTGANQYSIGANAILSGATFSASFLSQLYIATSTTAVNAAGLRVVNPILVGTGAITNCHGIYIDDLTSGTNHYGIRSLVTSGANKYNLYIDGTADNYFAGDVGIGTASPAVKLDVSGQIRASTGILFGTDTAAESALDDYEEGTWTPTYVPTTGAFTSVTYDAQRSGRYTKIGNVVYLQGTLRTDAITVGTAAGAVKVGGLPFTSISSAPNASVSVGYSAAFGGDEPNGGITISNTLTIGLYYKATSNGDSVELDVTDLATGANTNYVVFQVFYTV